MSGLRTASASDRALAVRLSTAPAPGLLASFALLLLLAGLGLSAAGCGDGEDATSSSTEEVEPSGTLDGSRDSSGSTGTTRSGDTTRSGSPGTHSGETSTSTESVTSSSEAPELRPCRANAECRGGELCEGGVCRAVCAPDIACEDEALPHCDEDAGFCVRCMEDAQCPEGRVCTEARSCTRACEEDATCGDDRVCETDRGYCVSRQCEQNSDCAGGFYCAGGRCIDLEDRVCVPQSGSCEENVLTDCNRYGTQERVVDCGDEALCVEDEERASCVPIVCDADTQRCTDEGTLALCNGLGTAEDIVTCGSNEVCDQNRCRTVVCDAGTITCDGDSVRVCNEAGTSAVLDPCNERGTCQAAPFGCACEAGACAQRVCEPDRARCVDGNPVRCSADGLDEVPLLTCDSEQICFGGECLNADCGPGETRCAGDVLLTCEGTVFVEDRDCAAEARFCRTSGGSSSCQDRICVPGTRTCNQGTLEICDSRGASISEQTCEGGTFCRDGACRERVCEPGALICANNSQVARCNDEGSDSTVTRTCDAVEDICEDGECVCRPERLVCGGACINPQISFTHCGSCNNACRDDQFCRNGTCDCPDNRTACGDRCVNTQTDPLACGSCTRRCNDGEVCRSGECIDLSCSCLDTEEYCAPSFCPGSIEGSEFGCCATNGCVLISVFGGLPCIEYDPNYQGSGNGSAP